MGFSRNGSRQCMCSSDLTGEENRKQHLLSANLLLLCYCIKANKGVLLSPILHPDNLMSYTSNPHLHFHTFLNEHFNNEVFSVD